MRRPHSAEQLPYVHQLWHGTQVPLPVWEIKIPPSDMIIELCIGLLPLPHSTGTGEFQRRTTLRRDRAPARSRREASARRLG